MRPVVVFQILLIGLTAAVPTSAQDACVTCKDRAPFLYTDGQFACGLQNPGCSVTPGTTGCPQRPPERSLQARAADDIYWSIWHQGAGVWSGNALLPAKELALSLMNANERDGRDRIGALYQSTPADVTRATSLAVQRCRAERPAQPHIEWFAKHEGFWKQLYTAAEQGNLALVRQTYYQVQRRAGDPANRDNLINLLACYPDDDLRKMVLAMGRP